MSIPFAESAPRVTGGGGAGVSKAAVAGALTVEVFNGAATEWDAFARAQRDATFCHAYGWRAVIHAVFGHETIYLAARNGTGALEGVLPLVRVKSAVFGHFLVSMPFLNYGGPIGSSRAIAALAAAAAAQASRDGVSLLELRSRSSWPAAPADDWTTSTRKITVVLDLPTSGGSAALWKQLDAKVRSQVRRPQKDGVTVRFGLDQLPAFYHVFARHMRDLGTPTQSRRLFEAIAGAFADDVWFGCAYLNDEPIAAGCGFQWGAEFEMTWASSLIAHKRTSANMLLYWAFMERAADMGLTTFNFGRCTSGSGTHKFKRQWGRATRDEQLWWYGHGQATASAARAKTPSPDDAAYAWGPRVWKRLPVALATALGPRIVKYIP